MVLLGLKLFKPYEEYGVVGVYIDDDSMELAPICGPADDMNELVAGGAVLVAGEWSVFDMELKRLDSPAPAAVIIDGPPTLVVGVLLDEEAAADGSLFDFFGDGDNEVSKCWFGYIDVS